MLFYNKQKKRAVKTALFEFLFEYNGDYIRLTSTPLLANLKSDIETTLKRETEKKPQKCFKFWGF